MRRPFALVLCAAITVGWLASILSAVHFRRDDRTLATSRQAEVLASAIYIAGSFICHQRPERSFHTAGTQWPVCARCTGLYAGAALGVVIWIALAGLRGSVPEHIERVTTAEHAKRALFILGAPTFVTVITAVVGLWDPGNTLRAALAAPLGGVAGAIVAAVTAGDLR